MRLNVELDEKMHGELMSEARAQGNRTASDVIRVLVFDWLQQSKKDKLQMMQLEQLNGEKDAR